MMRTLRKNTRWVLVIALVGFAGLIFFQWGLDITGIRREPETDIAEIEGVTITYQDYRRFAMNKEAENKGVTDEQLWLMLVEDIMWRKLAKKEKVGIVDEEILAIIRNNPPPEIYTSEFMQNENGEFDWNKYNELLRSPQSLQWLYQYEMRLREELPKEKLRSIISTMGWVSPFEDSVAMYGQTVKYGLSLLNLQINRLRGMVSVTDEEVSDYFKENKNEFKTPELKVLKYVFFERRPSSYDTSEARERLEDFIMLVEEGEDFLQLAREVSDDTTIEYNFGNDNVLKPYMKDVYRELRNGEVSDIVRAAHGFEVMKRVRSGLMYVVKADIEVSRTTVGEITDEIMSFMETGDAIGFDSAAVDFELTVRRTFPLDKEKLNFPVRNVEGLADFLKDAKNSDIGGPFSSLAGYYLFALDSIIPGTEPSLEEAFARVKAVVEREKFDDALVSHLEVLHKQLVSGKAMEAIAQADAIVIFQSNIRDQTVFTLRNTYGDKFAGTVAALEPGQISKPVIMPYTGYIIRCDSKDEVPFDSTMLGLLQWKRQLRLQQITQNIFTPEEVVDHRDKFFE
ncbi:peptidyl-prolyl cis-trans isomerase [candidate division WOR-3 bacterium]|nr:peptidyl-prolyl cis-trans isomerase [candidate division WOR-3 bacterium]